jgi:hypothetical protein
MGCIEREACSAAVKQDAAAGARMVDPKALKSELMNETASPS